MIPVEPLLILKHRSLQSALDFLIRAEHSNVHVRRRQSVTTFPIFDI